jgi:hypothetical protein
LAAVLVDERGETAPDPGPQRTSEAPPRPARPEAKPRPWEPAQTPRPERFSGAREVEMLDENGRQQSPAWVNLITGALERFERDRLPFAVLLVEVCDIGELRCGLPLARLPRLMREIESASSRVLEAIGARSSASVALEGATRLWLQVPEMDRLEAQALVETLTRAPTHPAGTPGSANPAERYFAALSSRTPPSPTGQNGRRLDVAIGVAICPEDGQDPSALVSQARTQLASAREVEPSSSS